MNHGLALLVIRELSNGRHLSTIASAIDILTEEYELIRQELELDEDKQGVDLLYIEYVEILDILIKELNNRTEELQEQYVIKEDFGV